MRNRLVQLILWQTAIFLPGLVFAEEQPLLGCIFVDREKVELPLEPWEAWQSWCDLSQDVESVQCFGFDQIEEQWVATITFNPEHLLERVEAGSGTCPALPDALPPDFRG